MVEAAEAKLLGAKDMVVAYEAKRLQANLNLDRQVSLFEKGIKPQVEIEKLQKDYDVADAELEKAKRDVTAAEREVAAKKQELEHKRSESQAKVDYARAMQQDALGQQNTAAKELRDLEMKLSELERLTIKAPRDGTIFRMPVFERGQVIKEGAELFTIVPQTDDLAVEMWLAGNDVPLVRVGDDVRLQFEGWPAVQFAGWPSVAVGTFPGKVAAIDQSDNGKGKFRIQVRPPTDVAWPSERYLRQGVRANGWVMLSQVRLGYEVWRQLNGFPPIVSDAEPEKKDDDKKSKVKLPK
jgi:multidrug resistance efflux pump